jgi:hypothetical protein
VPFGALLTVKLGTYLIFATCNSGFVASIFFAFFKVFLAILFPPRLICPVGHLPMYMQSNRQTSPSVRQSANCLVSEASPSSQSQAARQRSSAALN